jgi:uncharacterized BrkB/YihY/UPF0761 family membrane protein
MSTDINDALGVSPSSAPQHSGGQDKYSSLKNIAGIISIFAWVSGSLIFIIGVIAALNTRPRYGGGADGLSVLLILLYIYMAAFIVITLLAQAGVIKVLIDIEKNTRKTEKE